uniref:Uncharacterized protein n=2 Tax=Plectus sambesii TaxID=2011161 RepID=A0A914WSY0_9BILA
MFHTWVANGESVNPLRSLAVSSSRAFGRGAAVCPRSSVPIFGDKARVWFSHPGNNCGAYLVGAHFRNDNDCCVRCLTTSTPSRSPFQRIYEQPADFSDYASLIYGSVSSSINQLSFGERGKGMSTLGSSANQTLSSMEAELNLSGRGSACLSPASRIRIAADVHRQSTSDDDSGCALEEYAWVPSGLKPDAVHQYFACLPEDKIPYVNSAGDKWRTRQLLLQLPPQDTDSRYCRNLSLDEENAFKLFISQRKKNALGRATVHRVPFSLKNPSCHQCKDSMTADELGVFAARLGDRQVWHPGCFVCNFCDELLVDLIYFNHEGRVFCGRHHAETQYPRCAGCDEIIFSENCTEAEGRSWHMTHFTCFECDRQLGEQRYRMQDKRPYCIDCYDSVYGQRCACAACRLPINADDAYIVRDNCQWHASDRCFVCGVCSKSLLGKCFLPRRGKLYCDLDCYAVASAASPARLPITDFKPNTASTPTYAPSICPPPTLRINQSDDNIYETVLPTSRDQRQLGGGRMTASMMAAPMRSGRHKSGRSRRRRHRSLSAEVRADEEALHRPSASGSELSYRKALAHSVLSNGERRGRGQAEAASAGLQSPSTSTTGPMSARDFGRHQDECSTCSSSSDSDDDDAFLANYLAASLPRVNQIGQRPAQMQHKSQFGRSKRRLVVRADGKKVGSSNCIVS